MENDYGDTRGTRFAVERDERIGDLADSYRLDRAEVIRRMVGYAMQNADHEDLFAEEIHADRARERLLESEA